MKFQHYFLYFFSHLFYFLLLLNPLNAQWINVTNNMQNTNIVSAMVTLGSNILVGTNGSGLFRTTNYGDNWVTIYSLPQNLQVQTSTTLGTKIFIGTNGDGIYKSTNNGSSWSSVNNGLGSMYVYSLFSYDGKIYASTFNGLYRSDNEGTNWIQIGNGLPQNIIINSFAVIGNVLYAGAGKIYKSTDYGNTWTQVNFPSNNGIKSLIVVNHYLYAATDGDYVYRSSDGGSSWVHLTNGLNNTVQTLYNLGSNIFAGTNAGIFLSTDNGNSWMQIGLNNNVIYCIGVVNNYVFVGTWGAVYRRQLSDILSQTITITITSDNAYVFGFGNYNEITSYYFPGVCNLSAGEIYSPHIGAETYAIYEDISGKYIYIIAWSDEKVYQGVIAQFSDGNLTVMTSPNLPNPFIKWEVYATGIDLYPVTKDDFVPGPPYYSPTANSNCPTLQEVNNQITIANLNQGNPTTTSVGWVSTTPVQGRIGILSFGPNNNSVGNPFPPQIVSGINPEAQWMWYNPEPNNITNPFITGNYPNFPYNKSREYYIFRVGPLDSLFTNCNCVEPPNNMVGWWTLDESLGNLAIDNMGYPNNGYCTNCPALINGKVDKAKQFGFINNQDQHYEVPNNAELDLSYKSFTIDAWIKVGNCKEGTIAPIVDKMDLSINPPSGFAFYITQNSSGSVFLNLRLNSTVYTSTVPYQAIPNQWMHVAVSTYLYVGWLIFYINGQIVGFYEPVFYGSLTNNSSLLIGKSRLPNVKCTLCIDELEIFNRPISQPEIYSIWNADSCGKCKNLSPTELNKNHYKTWKLKPIILEKPLEVYVKDQFLEDYIKLVRIEYLSNPTKKVVEKDTFKVINQNNHLTWYRAYGKNLPISVNYSNQFEINNVIIDSLIYFLVPTQKLPHNKPDSLDHYKAYKIIRANTIITKGIMLEDQFDQRLGSPDYIKELIPKYFMTPTRKNKESLFDEVTHYVAYEIKPKRIYNGSRNISNQFGTYIIETDTCKFLLVPTKKLSSTIVNIFEKSKIPDDYALFQNYPNPFNSSTIIEFQVPIESYVKIIVYDELGCEVAVLLNQRVKAGNYKVSFNAENLASGIYFLRMIAGKFQQTKKLVLIK